MQDIEENVLVSFTSLGVRIGVQLSGSEPPAPGRWAGGPDELVGLIVRCATEQAVQIIRSLGLSRRVDLETFARIVGMIAGGATGLAQGLTGRELRPSDEAIREAEAAYVAAYRQMRKGG